VISLSIAAYLIGSFPTAYVIGKLTRGIDITKNGTGNIGAMNAYEVTGSKAITIAVGIIDMLKGFIAAFAAQNNFGLGISGALIAAFFVVLGHNYSMFMKFKGGRGLAAAAGAFIIIVPWSVVVYLAVYLLLRKLSLKLYLSSVAGILAASVPLLVRFRVAPIFEIVAAAIIAVVLSKHFIPLKNELQNGI